VQVAHLIVSYELVARSRSFESNIEAVFAFDIFGTYLSDLCCLFERFQTFLDLYSGLFGIDALV